MSTSTSVSASITAGSAASSRASLSGGAAAGTGTSGMASSSTLGRLLRELCCGGRGRLARRNAGEPSSLSFTSYRSGASRLARPSTSRASSRLPRSISTSAANMSSRAPSVARPSFEKSSARATAPARGSCVTAMNSFRIPAAPSKSMLSALCSARTTASFRALSKSCRRDKSGRAFVEVLARGIKQQELLEDLVRVTGTACLRERLQIQIDQVLIIGIALKGGFERLAGLGELPLLEVDDACLVVNFLVVRLDRQDLLEDLAASWNASLAMCWSAASRKA